MKKKKRVVVFGIFDGVHDGHRDLFRQAKEKGDELVVIVGRDSASLQWKGKKPVHSQEERLSLVLKERYVDNAILGDEKQSTYSVVHTMNPDLICLGYDQKALADDLKPWLQIVGKKVLLVQLQPFKPDTHHTSLLKRQG